MEKATYSLSALKQCKELIRKNRWSTRLKAEHNSRCAEVNVLFASCQKLLNYVMFQPDLSPAYDYQQMVLSKSCTKNNSTISFVFATRMPKDRLLLSKICTAEFLPNRAFLSHEAEFSEPRPSYGWLGFHPIARGMRRASS